MQRNQLELTRFYVERIQKQLEIIEVVARGGRHDLLSSEIIILKQMAFSVSAVSRPGRARVDTAAFSEIEHLVKRLADEMEAVNRHIGDGRYDRMGMELAVVKQLAFHAAQMMMADRP